VNEQKCLFKGETNKSDDLFIDSPSLSLSLSLFLDEANVYCDAGSKLSTGSKTFLSTPRVARLEFFYERDRRAIVKVAGPSNFRCGGEGATSDIDQRVVA